MKRKYILAVLLLLAIVIYFNTVGSVLVLDNNYIVKNETGAVIDAGMYRRWNKLTKEYDHILLFRGRSADGLEKVLVIVENDKVVGMPGDCYEPFWPVTRYFILQLSYQGNYYDNINDVYWMGFLGDIKVSNASITINTIKEFSSYGKQMVIERTMK